MGSCEDISLRELFSQYMDTGQAVFVQNLPNKASLDSVQCFIEVILKAGVIAMHWPVPGSKTCCIAVVDEPVTDFSLCSKLLQERPLEGNIVGLCALGRATGLFITRVPEECTDQFLELYFESPRSSGEEGCVSEVKSCDCCQNRMVVMVFENQSVAKRILERPSHPSLDKYKVHIDPYFPVLHNLLLQSHPKDDTTTAHGCSLDTSTSSTVSGLSSVSLQAGKANTNQPVVTCKETSDLPKGATKHPQFRSVSGHDTTSETNHQHAQYSKQVQAKTQNCEDFKIVKPKDSQTKLVPYQRSSSTKLRIFCEETETEAFEILNDISSEAVRENLHTRLLAGFPLKSELHDYEPAPESLEHKHSDIRYIATDPGLVVCDKSCPLFETTERAVTESTYQEDNVPDTRDNKFRRNLKRNKNKILTRKRIPQEESQTHPENIGTGSYENNIGTGSYENTSRKGESVILEVSKTNIVLLKINGFTKRCGQCKVILLEKQGQVQFEGDDDSVKQGKLKMYETLTDVEEKTKTLPKHHIAYISESHGYIRSQLTKRKIGVVINTNTDQCTLHSLAFSAEQAERGLEFVTKELVSRSINIRDGQLQCFQGMDWENILQSLQNYVQVTVLQDEKSVDIVAFDEKSVSKARQKVIEYLKESVPKTKTEVELKGALARCFSHYFLENLKRKIRGQNGELECKKKADETLKILVTGDDSLAKMIREKVNQIWHEKVDFKKITTDINDLWLLMKGLASQKSKEFLDKFEREHSCFIDLTKDGVVSLPIVTTQRLETDPVDTHRLSSPPLVRRAVSESGSHSAQPPHSVTVSQDSHSVKSYRSSLSQEKATEYQLDLTEDEALQWALQASAAETALPAHPGISRSYTTGDIEGFGVEPSTGYDREEVGALKRSSGYEFLYHGFARPDYQHPVQLPYTAVSRPVIHPQFESPQQTAPFALKKQPKTHIKQFGQTTVTVKQGSIATEKVGFGQSVAKVNIVSPSLDLEKESIISKAFVEAGGVQLIKLYEQAKQQSNSSVIVTQGCGSLGCDYVIHVSLKKHPKEPRTVIAPLMQECFQLSFANGCQHVMFPPLGVGRLYQYPAAKVAKCMVNEILRHSQQRRALKMITLVIYEKDEETYQTFESALLQASLNDLQEYASSEEEVMIETPFQHLKRLADEKRRRSVPTIAVAPDNPFSNRLSNAIVDELGQRPVPAPRQRRLVKPVRAAPRPERLHTVVRSVSPSDAHTRPHLVGQPSSRRPAHRSDERERSPNTQAYPVSRLRRRHDSSSEMNYESDKSAIRPDKSERMPGVEQPRRPSQKKAKERTPEEPAVNYVLKVFSQDRTSCERARNELGKQLKGQFLYEKVLERRGKISADCKMKIRGILRKWSVMSFPLPNSKNYALKGEEKSVTEAYAEILKILLDEGKESEKSFANRRARRRELHQKPEEFARHMAFDHDPEIPTYWKNFKPGSPISAVFTLFKTGTKDFIKVKLDTNDPVSKAIHNLINTTWDGSIIGQGKDARGLESLSYTNIRVTKIQRVENLHLFEKYMHRRKHVFVSMTKRKKSSCTSIKRLPGSTGCARTEELQRCHVFDEELCHEVNEHFFFHGTSGETVDAICDNGLDCRLGSHQAMYGAGVYGAESPTKADQYADARDNRTKDGKKMFLIRMVLGESFLCTDANPHKYRRPPCANTQCLKDDCREKGHGSFDSVIGQSGRLFREFVVYQPEQCYPEYIISYDRV